MSQVWHNLSTQFFMKYFMLHDLFIPHQNLFLNAFYTIGHEQKTKDCKAVNLLLKYHQLIKSLRSSLKNPQTS